MKMFSWLHCHVECILYNCFCAFLWTLRTRYSPLSQSGTCNHLHRYHFTAHANCTHPKSNIWSLYPVTYSPWPLLCGFLQFFKNIHHYCKFHLFHSLQAFPSRWSSCQQRTFVLCHGPYENLTFSVSKVRPWASKRAHTYLGSSLYQRMT